MELMSSAHARSFQIAHALVRVSKDTDEPNEREVGPAACLDILELRDTPGCHENST